MPTHLLVRTNPIRQRRIQRGLTQAELGKLADLSPSKVCQLERGLLARPADLVKLARALECGLHELEPRRPLA